MRIKELLMEGGNVFDGTTPFNHNVIPDILKIINGALKETGIKVIFLTIATKEQCKPLPVLAFILRGRF